MENKNKYYDFVLLEQFPSDNIKNQYKYIYNTLNNLSKENYLSTIINSFNENNKEDFVKFLHKYILWNNKSASNVMLSCYELSNSTFIEDNLKKDNIRVFTEHYFTDAFVSEILMSLKHEYYDEYKNISYNHKTLSNIFLGKIKESYTFLNNISVDYNFDFVKDNYTKNIWHGLGYHLASEACAIKEFEAFVDNFFKEEMSKVCIKSDRVRSA